MTDAGQYGTIHAAPARSITQPSTTANARLFF
ncbi:hypothetical protein SAMN05216202_2301 [Pseudomonas mucidolens]|uniref:Uncharacterized protein n=1 Tax=Pseudomonas mucidolens TaxID=46679 RepID=A0A1H2MTC4_9PSED|nr:hypothetical protein SAMN05216202_2301 [Pseudomonas mucidolens]SQH33306.1 Uncharacterised protein [Pseudomonas mucidolens]